MLAHTPCGGIVIFDGHGTGKCAECGKVVKVRLSSK